LQTKASRKLALVIPQSWVEKRSAVILTASKMLNVTNFSKGKTIEGKTIKKFSNCLSLF
jgi:hypothetical protein